ncbi:MAG TPA: serine/threonine-protein kinase, partial [Polyangiaceae bacterium]
MTGGPATPNEARVRFSRAAGTRELGKYLLFVKLGSGGQAEVFLAVEQGLSGVRRLVVIKRMRDDLAAHVDIVEMFIDEARLSTRLSHPNIVHTYEVGESEGSYFIAMEYLDGQTLEAVLRSRGGYAAITPRMWAAIACEALAGLHYAHELRDFDGAPLQIVHRDMSPHNVFLTYDGEVKIVDFGIAKATLNTLRTETGVLKGKLTYMAPEQTQGKADRRSDIFVVGIILWEAFAGRRLFKGEPLAVLNALVHDPIPPIENPDVDARLKAIVMQALARDPSERFQTAEEMREALEEYVRATGEPVRKAELGRAVATMFQSLHDSVKGQIQQYMVDLSSPASMRSESPSRPELAVPELQVERPFSSGIGKAYDPDASMTGTRTRSVGSTMPAPPSSSAPLLGAILGAGLLVAGGAYLVS